MAGTTLLDLVLEAHGGLDRWRQARTIRAHLDMGGPTFQKLGQEKTLTNVEVTVYAQEQRTVFDGFTGTGRRGIYTPDHVAIEDSTGAVVTERRAPRESFPRLGGDLSWDALHVLYFAGYGLWNYLTTPYLLTLPGVRTEELEPSEELRRLRVSFPPRIAVHSTEQIFHFDEAGLLRRLEYAPEVLGSRPALHYTEQHRMVSGLLFPTYRHVHPIQNGSPGQNPIITVDLSDIAVDFAD